MKLNGLIRILGFEFNYRFSFYKVKRMDIDIPDWADDVHVRRNNKDDKYNVVYYKGSKIFQIPIPYCTKCKTVSLSPLYNKERTDYNKNRKITIDLYY